MVLVEGISILSEEVSNNFLSSGSSTILNACWPQTINKCIYILKVKTI